MLLRDFACPLYKLQLLCHIANRIVSRTAKSFGAKARKRACCEPRMSNQGDADSRGHRFASTARICTVGPFNAVGSLVAQAKAYRAQWTWGMARGAAQTSMQGSLGGRSSHEEENHERGSSCRVGWAVRERETTVHVMDERYCYAHCNSVLTSAWLAGRVKTYVMLYVNHNHSNTRGGKLRQSSSHVAEWTEDNRYSFRVAFIELRVRRSTPAHGWLAVSPSPRPSCVLPHP